MFYLLVFCLIVVVLSMVVMLIALLVSKKVIIDREKNSPYECGFDPKGSARLPFSLRFFLIAVIFLIFDVEITLLLPLVWALGATEVFYWVLIGFFFVLVLLLGLYYEWDQGALDWAD